MKGRNKFGAKAAYRGTRRYDSQLEARYADKLRLAQKSGQLAFFLEQVPLRLTGGTVLRLDFVEFWNTDDGYEIRWVDVKSPATAKLDTFKIKKREVEAIYPIEIEIEMKA